jgi:hypothetical protein
MMGVMEDVEMDNAVMVRITPTVQLTAHPLHLIVVMDSVI